MSTGEVRLVCLNPVLGDPGMEFQRNEEVLIN